LHAEEAKKTEDQKYDPEKDKRFDKKSRILKKSHPISKGDDDSVPPKPPSPHRKSSIFRSLGRRRSQQLSDQGLSRGLSRGGILGRIFLTAAFLFEKMEYFYDEMSLKLSIYAQAPLHPRRTLHQYRYGTRKSTEKLDKTQVVYRRTAPSREYLHHPACEEKDRQKCQHAHCEKEDTHEFRDCRQCFSDSRKLPRMIMVDQLWLWVLDGSKHPPNFTNISSLDHLLYQDSTATLQALTAPKIRNDMQ
jgi:hypothetical protein